MKIAPMQILKWLLPVFLILLGIFLRSFIHGHSFLGFLCFCLAGLCCCYYGIAMLENVNLTAAKLLRFLLTGFVCLGLLVCGVTEVLILRAGLGHPEADCPYVIVLGAKVNGTAPSLSLSDRINAAYDYLTAHPRSIAILSGGQGPDEGISEAQCMFRGLTDRGIDPERLWLEDRATSTWENLQFSMDIIESRTGARPDTVGLLSSEYHLFRASLFARDCGITAIGIPARTSWLSISINYHIREVAGVWHYLILGGQYHD